MKLFNKKTLLIGFLLSTSLFASTYEYPQVYKDTKIMGMGGANIALGGQTSSLFYNTAGLSSIAKKDGWKVDLFNINGSISSNILDFVSDMNDANSDDKTNNEKTTATLDVAENYLGKNLHISNNIALLSVGKKFDKYAIGVMPIAGVNINMKTHRGSGSSGLLEIGGIVYGGVAIGVSRDINNKKVFGYDIQNISLGIGIKTLKYKTIDSPLSISELIDDNLSDYFEKRYTKDGSSLVFDLGLKANIYDNLSAGISLQNIGSIASSSKTSKIPMTLGLGIAYSKNFYRSYFNKYQIAIDYIDLFQSYSQDKDFIKRTRIGLSGNLVEGWFGKIDIQTGLYQGYPTFGIDLRMTMLKLAYTMYSEEIGAYSGQDKDTRQMVQLSITW